MKGKKLNHCLSCGSQELSIFFGVQDVPVHSVLLMRTRQQALDSPKGDILLAFCRDCGFVSNIAFDPTVHEYSPQVEETEAFSPTFNVFHRKLAKHLIQKHGLKNKDVIEIGCGKGEFLTLLCELGPNRGVGFDPAFVSHRHNGNGRHGSLRFIQDFYSDKYSDYKADFVCCKMTLEHIHDTANFVSMVRRSLDGRRNVTVFFQVPDHSRVLRELAFWDIYYEHCSYFSLGSLGRLFRKCGFDVTDLWKDYGDQCLMIEARPRKGQGSASLPQEDDMHELVPDVVYFSKHYRHKRDLWKLRICQFKRQKKRVVLWGAGSKGVAFLTRLKIHNEIEYTVDVNPHKHGTYMAGTGHLIVGPGVLKGYKPDVVIVMNPVYLTEIRHDLNQMGLHQTELISVNLDGKDGGES